MRFWVFLCAAMLSPFVALSEVTPILVRSGAHDGFSRLVLDVLPDTDWSIETAENSARVTIQDHEGGFKVENVFDRIDQTHVGKLNSDTGSLEIFFSCDCEVTAFEQGDRMIVLDVMAAPDDPSSRTQPAEWVSTGPTNLLPLQFDNRVAPNSGWQSDSAAVTWGASSTSYPSAPNTQTQLIPTEGNDAAGNSLAQTQQQISQQVATAATRGLLTAKTTEIELPLVQNRPQIDTEIFDSSKYEPARSQPNTSPAGGNLKITSSSDIPNGADLLSLSTTLGIHCIDPQVTAIQDWATDMPFSVQIAEHRNKLFSEFDKLDQDAAVKLARTYLHFGFGLEAMEVLALDPQLAKDNPALQEMAEIMEYGYTKQPEYLHHFMECDTNVALWAILSKRAIQPSQSINTSAALRSATALPMHMRSFIAPELSRRFLEYGDTDAAEAALRSLERAAQPLSSGANLAKADIEMAQGKISQAQDRLAHVVTSNVEQSAEALIKFVDSHVEADVQIDQNVATLVEAYALQMRDDPIGAELRRTHVLALGKSGQFNAAFEALDRVRERSEIKTDNTVASALLGLLAKNGSDIEFLDHVFQQMPVTLSLVEPTVSLEIADRLVGLGFAVEAERILAARADIPGDDSSRIIRAKIALSLARPFEAEALMFGVETAEADTLRAEAKTKSGAFDEAHSLFAQVGEEDGRRQTAWLSNDWASLVGQDTPVLGSVARVAQTQISADTNPDGMLSRTSDAISESAEARSVIEELLRMSNPDGVQE